MDNTCGSPDCNHPFCIEQRAIAAKKRADAKAKREKAVADVAAAIKQVMKVEPQLLYEAAVQAYSELAVESLAQQFKKDNTPEKQKRANLTSALCSELGKLLLRSGNAKMTDEHLASMIAFMQLSKK